MSYLYRVWARKFAPLLYLLALGLAFGTYKLSESPKSWYDEGMFMQVARNLDHGASLMRLSPDVLAPSGFLITVGDPIILPVYAAFKLWGVGFLQARIPMVGYILLLIAAGYAYVRTIWGKRSAWWAGLLIATHAPVYGNGKNVLGDVPGMAWLFVFLISIGTLNRQAWRGRWSWAAAGVAAGLFAASKPNFLFIVPILIGLAIWKRSRLQLHAADAIYGAIGLCVPIIGYFMTHFGIDPRTWVDFFRYAGVPGIADVAGLPLGPMMLKNVLRFFHESSPMLVLGSLLPWVISFGLRLRKQEKIHICEWIAMLSTGLTLVYFIRMPGFYRYLLPAQLLIFAHLPQALRRFRLLSTSWFVPALLGAMCIFQTYQVMFDSFAQAYYDSHRSAELTAFANGLDPHQSIFVYAALDLAAIIPHENYYQFFHAPLMRREIGQDGLEALRQGIPDIVVVPQDFMEEAVPYLGAYTQAEPLKESRFTVFRHRSGA